MCGKWNVFSSATMSFALKAVMKVCITSSAGLAPAQAVKSFAAGAGPGFGAQAAKERASVRARAGRSMMRV